MLFVLISTYPLDIEYPEDFYFIDTKTNYKIILGLHIDYFLKEYGNQYSREVLLQLNSPKYEIIRLESKEIFEIIYETFNYRIISIRINSNRFITTKGITVGFMASEIVNVYGLPEKIFIDKETNITHYIYSGVFKEIHNNAEYLQIAFEVLNDKVISICLSILDTV